MEPIYRGTTPSLVVDFAGTTVNMDDIHKAVLTLKRRDEIEKYTFENGLVKAESAIVYHWTQAATLALKPRETIKAEMDILLTDGERYRCLDITIPVENTLHGEVM